MSEDITTEFDHRATYSPEDNKLRFYPDWSDPSFDKEDIKAAGYRWASKQECYVCPRWTPSAEDAALSFVEDIEDEDYSPTERSADRAERFGGYRDRRRDDAHGLADRYESGPDAYGGQNGRRAERAASRRDRLGERSLTQWSRAEYWQTRTAGVISHALHRARPDVRRRRIKKLEAEQRKVLKSQAETVEYLKGWSLVRDMEGADVIVPLSDQGYVNQTEANAAGLAAYRLTNDGRFHFNLPHPTDEAANEYSRKLHGRVCWSPYDLLTDTHYGHGDERREFQRMTPRHLAEWILSKVNDPTREGTYSRRWAEHYENRLTYERAMLANEGGAADDADTDVVPGGWIFMRGEMGQWCCEHAPAGWVRVQKVHKSPATKKVTSVQVWGTFKSAVDGSRPYLVKVDITSFAADRYRAPTPEDLETFKAEQKAEKAKAKANKPKAPSLINPTDEDAQRLQDVWNAQYKARVDAYNARSSYGSATYKPVEVCRITQTQYSAVAKGAYSRADTLAVMENGLPDDSRSGRTTARTAPIAFKVRKTYPGEGHGFTHAAYRVIVLTDKPQKALPLDWAALEAKQEETADA